MAPACSSAARVVAAVFTCVLGCFTALVVFATTGHLAPNVAAVLCMVLWLISVWAVLPLASAEARAQAASWEAAGRVALGFAPAAAVPVNLAALDCESELLDVREVADRLGCSTCPICLCAFAVERGASPMSGEDIDVEHQSPVGGARQPQEANAASNEERMGADAPTFVRKLRCGHHFHARCVDHWVLSGRPCPVCRTEVVACRSSPVPPQERRVPVEDHARDMPVIFV